MKLTLPTPTLARLAKRAESAARGGTVAIYKSVMLSAQGDSLEITGGQGSLSLTQTAPAQVAEAGECLVDAAKLASLAATLPSGEVELTHADDKLHIKAGRGRYRLPTLPTADYPLSEGLEVKHHAQIEQWQLASMLRFVQAAQGKADTRFYLNGVHFLATQTGLRVAAADGHRCHAATEPEIIGEWEAIYPTVAVKELLSLLDPDSQESISIELSRAHSDFIANTWRLRTSHIEGRYPNIQRLIEGEPEYLVKVSRQELHDCANRLQSGVLDRNTLHAGIAMSHTPGKITLEAATTNQEKGLEEIDVESDAPDAQLGLSSRYLIDALSAYGGDTIEMRFFDAKTKITLHDGEPSRRFILLMPMAL
jgi:DNA polymerase-3 subunit beta